MVDSFFRVTPVSDFLCDLKLQKSISKLYHDTIFSIKQFFKNVQIYFVKMYSLSFFKPITLKMSGRKPLNVRM